MGYFARDALGCWGHFARSTDNQTNVLPIGVWHVGTHEAGLAFKPAKLREERYVPVDTPEARAIIREVDNFFDPVIQDRLKRAGIARKRGIILHGPPGTGKTSLIMSLVPSLVERGAQVILDCNADFLEHGIIPAIREHDPDRPIVCIWDEFDKAAQFSRTELLRLLDGAVQCDLLLCIGNTNHLDRVPIELRSRPSRFSLVLKMPSPPANARIAFLRGQFGEVLSEDEIQMVAELTEGVGSMDHVKEIAILALMGYDHEDLRLRLYNATIKGQQEQASWGKAEMGEDEDDED